MVKSRIAMMPGMTEHSPFGFPLRRRDSNTDLVSLDTECHGL
jgi:hypothetical protein